jgi:hypothetical protein
MTPIQNTASGKQNLSFFKNPYYSICIHRYNLYNPRKFHPSFLPVYTQLDARTMGRLRQFFRRSYHQFAPYKMSFKLYTI